MTRVFTGPVVAHDVVPQNRPLFAVKQHHCQPNFFRNHESIAWLDEAGIGRLSPPQRLALISLQQPHAACTRLLCGEEYSGLLRSVDVAEGSLNKVMMQWLFQIQAYVSLVCVRLEDKR
jgi:hypothetical protein